MTPAPHRFSLRPAVPEDLPFPEAVRRTVMRAVIENHCPWDEHAQRERVLAHFDCAQVIVVEGRDVGLFKVVRRPDEIHLSQVQLLPEYQGGGIASALIRDLQQEAAVARLPITLDVLRSNPALALYRRLGFVTYEENLHFFLMRWTPRETPANVRVPLSLGS